jgi:pilus assembly protein Flp/PilA
MTHLMHTINRTLYRFRRDDHAASMVEYGLVVAVIAVVAVVAAGAVGTGLTTRFDVIAAEVAP